MNKFILLGFIFLSYHCFAQEYNFKKPKNLKLKITTEDSYRDSIPELNITDQKSFYDLNDNLIKTINYWNNQIASNPIYEYDSLNRLTKYTDIGRRSYQILPDSITGEDVETSEYDSTVIVMIKKYKYQGKKLKQIDWYEFGKVLIISEMYDYDDSNRLINKTSISYPSPNTLIYFKPGTTEIDWEHPRLGNISVNSKKCRYIDDLRLCEYYDSTNLISIDTTFYTNELITRSVIYSVEGEKTFESFYHYNKENQLVNYKTTETGKSPFGGQFDLLSPKNIIFKYNLEGYLTGEEYYFDNKLMTRFHYKYEAR